jgi:electron transport complex protein RnfG
MSKKDDGFFPALILTVIVLVTTGLLALTSALTQTARESQAAAAALASREQACPGAARFDPIDLAAYAADFPGVSEAYAVRDNDGRLTGFLYQSASRGYGGEVPVLVAVDLRNTVTRVLPLENNETPGLGRKIAEESFISQFQGLDAAKVYTVRPGETDKVRLDAIAGATISSNAVTQAVNQAVLLHQVLVAEVK